MHPRPRKRKRLPLWFHVMIGVVAGLIVYHWSVLAVVAIAGELGLLE